MLALIDLHEGDTPSATRRARAAFGSYSQLEDDRSRARCVLVLAASATEEGNARDAARLLGAAEALRGGAPPDEFESPLLERCLPELEGKLGRSGFEELAADGARRPGQGESVIVLMNTQA
jgi:hypothetical protein